MTTHTCDCESSAKKAQEDEARLYDQLDTIIEKHKNVKVPLIQVLHAAQKLFGYLPERVQVRIAKGLGIPLSEVCGLIIMDENTYMVDLTRYLLDFIQDESCGKCTPCRVGTKRMLEILNRICQGMGRGGHRGSGRGVGQVVWEQRAEISSPQRIETRSLSRMGEGWGGGKPDGPGFPNPGPRSPGLQPARCPRG